MHGPKRAVSNRDAYTRDRRDSARAGYLWGARKLLLHALLMDFESRPHQAGVRDTGGAAHMARASVNVRVVENSK